MFLDRVKILIKAGNGGNGSTSFLRNAMTAKGGHDDACEKTEGNVKHNASHVVAHARRVVFVAQNLTVDHPADDAGEKHNKRVGNALHKRHRHHVAVGNVAHFMRENRFNFLLIHESQQTGGHRHQRAVLGSAGRKGIRFAFVNAHFGHLQTELVGLSAHHAYQPLFQTGSRVVGIDKLHAHAHLGHGLAHEKRNDGAGKAHHERKDKECAHVEAAACHLTEIEPREHAHNREHDAEHDDNGNVRKNQKRDSLHMFFWLPS